MLIPVMQSWFGYGIPTEEKFRMIRDAGFPRISLFWGNSVDVDEAPCYKQPDMAARVGLTLDNFHYPFEEANQLWLDTEAGERLVQTYLDCIDASAAFGIGAGVIHLTRTYEPPPYNALGLDRLKRILERAEKRGVRIAFENLARIDYIDWLREQIQSDAIGICYDAGHEHCYTKQIDVPARYAGRICVVHVSDNDGETDQHKLPFTGSMRWEDAMARLRRSGYSGGMVIEAVHEPEDGPISAETFLQQSYAAAERLIKFYEEACIVE